MKGIKNIDNPVYLKAEAKKVTGMIVKAESILSSLKYRLDYLQLKLKVLKMENELNV